MLTARRLVGLTMRRSRECSFFNDTFGGVSFAPRPRPGKPLGGAFDAALDAEMPADMALWGEHTAMSSRDLLQDTPLACGSLARREDLLSRSGQKWAPRL